MAGSPVYLAQLAVLPPWVVKLQLLVDEVQVAELDELTADQQVGEHGDVEADHVLEEVGLLALQAVDQVAVGQCTTVDHRLVDVLLVEELAADDERDIAGLGRIVERAAEVVDTVAVFLEHQGGGTAVVGGGDVREPRSAEKSALAP